MPADNAFLRDCIGCEVHIFDLALLSEELGIVQEPLVDRRYHAHLVVGEIRALARRQVVTTPFSTKKDGMR